MPRDNVPAGVPKDPAAMVELVKQQAAEEWEEGGLPPDLLDSCARRAVASALSGSVTTFVPVLALRRLRACIRAGTCDGEHF